MQAEAFVDPAAPPFRDPNIALRLTTLGAFRGNKRKELMQIFINPHLSELHADIENFTFCPGRDWGALPSSGIQMTYLAKAYYA
jgi:hypothetical protein